MRRATKKIIAFVLVAAICVSTAGFAMRPVYAASGDRPSNWDETIVGGEGINGENGDGKTGGEGINGENGDGKTGGESINGENGDGKAGGENESGEPSDDENAPQDSAKMPATRLSTTVEGVVVTVEADEGAFPDGIMLYAAMAPEEAQSGVDAAVESQRDDNVNVAASYTFDIRILDKNRSELQPANNKKVRVSFSTAEVSNENLSTEVYHIVEGEGASLSAEQLNVATMGETATVVTGGFSYYTVEFTYGEKQFVMPTEDGIYLSEILSAIGLDGAPTSCSFSDPSLFHVCPWEGNDVWFSSNRPFTTTEWMRVVIDGIEYEITLTDAIINGPTGSNNETFAQEAKISSITIDKKKLMDVGNVRVDVNTISSGLHVYRTGDKQYIAVRGAEVNSGYAHGIKEFTLTYPNAAVLSDGTTKDLVFTFTGGKLHTREIAENKSEAKAYTIFDIFRSKNDSTTGDHVDAPSLFGQDRAETWTSGGTTYTDTGNIRHAGIYFDNVTVNIPGADASDTFFYTLFGVNVDRRYENAGYRWFSHVNGGVSRLDEG